MADALISAPVAGIADVVAGALVVLAGQKLKHDRNNSLIPLMGGMGAFIFAAQMINFSIPGTGSSGHIIGGVLLAAVLGPWAAFLTLACVLLIQCLVFADGGLMAIGCNIINMGAMSSLVAYPLIFKPMLRFPASPWKIMGVSVLTCVIGLELGACLVVGETIMSGITALPADKFCLFMLPIHLVIGVGEGLATGAVLCFLQRTRPDLLDSDGSAAAKKPVRNILIGFAVAAVVIGGGLAYLASSNPDGLEWSIEKVAGSTEIEWTDDSQFAKKASEVQASTAVMPDYDHSLSGIIGAAMTMLVLWVLTTVLMRSFRKSSAKR